MHQENSDLFWQRIICKMRKSFIIFLILLFILPVTADARSKGNQSSHTKTYCSSCTRDKHGKIARSSKAKQSFRKNHPCPSTGKTSGACAGHVIDHIKPLKKGGRDASSNMQWQTVKDAKAKDKRE